MELIKQTHEAYLGKAKELKEALKKRDIERDGSVSFHLIDPELTVQRPQPHPIVIIINSQSLWARDDLNGKYSRSNESIIW